ncbi:CRR6 family NdhI maturation factor [Cyanobium sp. HWJ4-Hawea]|nr:CRR6 family NdhI maturation factor [Cyanobium sp. HWJ4-Hawea]MCP9809339.1 CRR6 family NdhI maturation factor [Cyanobium sp. HWJ4-Hawea]
MAAPGAAPGAAAGAAPGAVEIGAAAIGRLDLTPLASWAELGAVDLVRAAGCLELSYLWPRQADDPRELSEIAELRLWTLYADATYPWLPLVLERASGQLTRHVAMLLPHHFSRNEGIRFAPEALELWITHRLFGLDAWAQGQGLNCRQGLAQMAAVLGYELDSGFWELLPASPGNLGQWPTVPQLQP